MSDTKLLLTAGTAGKVIYAPIITTELRQQAHEWYSHLPAAISFPIDDTPLFDPRKSFLRLQYLIMFIVLDWASVLRVLEFHDRHQDPAYPQGELPDSTRYEVAECIKYCCLYLGVAEEQLAGRKLGTHVSVWR